MRPVVLVVFALLASASAQPSDLAEADRLGAAADSLLEAGAYAEAEDAARAALRLTEAAVGPDDPRLADRLSTLAYLLEGGGAVQEAEPLYARALALSEAAPGQPGLGDHLTNLGLARQALGDHASANALFARAASVFEDAGDPVGAAESRYNLGLGLFYLGAYAEAAPHYEAALGALEEALGPDHIDLTFPISGLARVDHAAGDYAAARAGYERTVALLEAELGPDHPAVANDRNELGWLLVDIGDYAEAARVSESVVAATDSVRGAEAVASRALYNLGVARSRLGQTAEADAAFARALEIREATLGPDHPGVAQLLAERAALAERAGDLEEAADLHRRALAIREAALGDDHPNVAATLDRLAWVDARLGAGDRAVAQARRALDVWKETLPPGHPSVALSQTGLAEVLRVTGTEADDEAERLLLASSAALTDHARTTVADLAWAEQRAFLDATLRRQTATVLTALGDAPAFGDAYAEVAGWKGLLLHGLRRQAALGRLGDDPAHAEAVEALAAVRADLAGWFQQAGTMPLAVWQARNDSLNARKEALERDLAGALPPGALGDPLADLLSRGGVPAFRAKLPAATAFVDVYLYGRRASADSLIASYAVAVSSPDGLAFVPLGPASEIDAAIDGWRRSVVRGGDGEAEWDRLGDLVWTPLAAALPEAAEGVWVSPDGLLGRVPWSLLPGDGGPSVSVVDSARELVYLLDREAPRGGPEAVLAVGDVDFGEGYRFDPLPATVGEVDVLRTLAQGEGARFVALTGAEATPEAVRARLPRATHVHLATHGVFVDDATSGDGGAWARSPLVESGLAFAGANEGPGGMLTAETLVGVDHSGTDLVVLSACETGLGTEVDGQGVMGLRAAFTTAGARSVLMSLWPVPDESTAALMGHFYRALWDDGLSVAGALGAAQAALRADPAHAAPRSWAGWMVVGAGW